MSVVPFSPERVRDQLEGCCICHRLPIVMVGVFVPETEELKKAMAILWQREHPVPNGLMAHSTAYGLCIKHAITSENSDSIMAQVEASFLATALQIIAESN